MYCKKESLIKVLILSGRNNHEWQKTTPVLVNIYNDSRLFTVKVTENPDKLRYNDLRKFDVIISNWNSWPDNDFRMTGEWERDFLRYIGEGGGVVSVHAGASSFYNWNEYHQIGIGRWGKETSHGEQTKAKVYGFDQTHPVTKELEDFYIVDEIWEKPDIWTGAQAIASVTATDEKDGHVIKEGALFVNNFKKGRTFFTTLGHNERALLNSGLKTILLRAAQWTAHRKVTIEPPADMKERIITERYSLSWKQSDTTLTLINNSDIIWQFNFRNRFGKPYFHPVRARNSTLTCVSPPDHPWHLALWFSWKFINGVNYWEYLNDFKSEESGYRSAGITDIQKSEIIKNPDFSADIRMALQYHPEGGDTVMAEKRNFHVSPPLNDGSYFIDNEYIFNPLIDEVVLDRTPIEGEPEGKSWGGYAGLSIRFNQDFTSPEIVVPSDSDSYRKDDWLYMGFNTLSGEKAGICILKNPKFTTTTTSWYVINEPLTPFYYYSPAVLYDGRIKLKKGEIFHLKYRVWILPGRTGKGEIQVKYDEYLNNLPQYN
jgi:type 1 glutamine amidotransferase